ncbi:DUF697 domain-containing protein, partial [Falsiroseomonas oryziterrae]|uniref:DUF697 domain-containing protein n=1 Tax=Falsiroseomonas oryziterrae TaxID=2911368 RepID=UPI001F42EEBB
VPVPLLGVGGVASANALMLNALAARYGVAWTRADIAAFAAAIGGGAALWAALQYGLREVAKLIPGIGTLLGGTLNAAAAFAITYGLGEAACVWLAHARRGEAAPPDEVRRAFQDALADAVRRSKPA